MTGYRVARLRFQGGRNSRLALQVIFRVAIRVAVAVRAAIAFGASITVPIAVMARGARHGGAVLVGKGADAIADPVGTRGELRLAVRDSLLDLLAPGCRVQAARRGNPGHRGRRSGNRHPGEHFDGEGGAGTSQQCLEGAMGLD